MLFLGDFFVVCDFVLMVGLFFLGDFVLLDGWLLVDFFVDMCVLFFVYLYILFCIVCCGYCDFNIYMLIELCGVK